MNRKPLFFLPVLFFCCLFARAQSETATAKAIASRFERYYNGTQYDSIFLLFSPEMKAALPREKTIDFLTQLQAQAGKLRSREFRRYQNSYASYKTVFERGTFALNISVDGRSEINGLFIKPYTEAAQPAMERSRTKLTLPVTGEWFVFWGGDTKEQNYHVESEAQKHAFDLLVVDAGGKTFKGSGTKNEDYFAFGKEILAPCEGEVVLAVDGVKDNIPGEMNPIYIPGNSVMIRTANNEYLLFAHFRQGSVRVKQGQKLKTGDVLGLCGNSGNSSEPHLHFHLQNVEDMTRATGVKAYFDTIKVNGTTRSDYSPVKGEQISN